MPPSFSDPATRRQRMATLQVTAVPAFTDNYLWLIHAPADPRRVVAVDPGDAVAIKAALTTNNLKLAGILVTHHHSDHVGGVATLQSGFDVPLYGPLGEDIPGQPVRVHGGDTVTFDSLGLEFSVLAVPGHTRGHVAYVGHGAVFCGDTLFSAGCGRLFEGTPEQMTESLARLKSLPPDIRVYCAHEYTVSNLRFAAVVEPDNVDIHAHLAHCEALRASGGSTLPSTLALEIRINPFLRLSAQSVKRAAASRAGRSLHSDTDTFAVLREWKNQFRG
jgi:hydroxyacylglutathione hydrolase